jgi:hypothetical protein
MKTVVSNFVQSCIVCQQAKPDRMKSPGLLQPLAVPEGAWQVVTMDFVDGLSLSGSANCILVVVDKFTKYAHFLPLKHPYTAMSVAKVYMDHVYRLHGLPVSIVTDRDSIFTSNLWRELFALAQVQLNMSSAYHPQSDGQTERVNQCMETFLRCFASGCPKKWLQWLPLAEYWYNTSMHSAIGCSPFEALYGYAPHHFGFSAVDHCKAVTLDQWLQDRKVMTALIKQHLHRASLRMKKQADKGRSERQFQVGDLVFLKIQPYVQMSLAPRANAKLSYKFFGPFPVLELIGSVAYKLALPPSSHIHPVFHVSQLKKVVGASVQVSPSLHVDDSLLQFPEKVLQRRLVTKNLRTVLQVLVKWSASPASLAT